MRVFQGIDELAAAVGEHIGYSDWHTVTQQQIDTFAEATGDHQWIHIDQHQAAKGPFGTTIAHGYLTLSLLSKLLWEIYDIKGVDMTVNYGLEKVRFPTPVPVDSQLRASAEILEVMHLSTHAQLTLRVTMHRRGQDKPICVAEAIFRLVPGQQPGTKQIDLTPVALSHAGESPM